MGSQPDAAHKGSIVDRVLSPGHVTFWTLLASIAAVVGLILAIAAACGGRDDHATGPAIVGVTQTSASQVPAVNNTPAGSPSSSSPAEQPTTEPPVTAQPEIQYVADLKPASRTARVYETGSQKVDATVYTRSLYALSCPGCYVVSPEYDLNRRWTNFHAVIGIDDNSDDANVVLQFEVFADGKRVGEVNRLSLGQHLEINRNVAGALRLKLVLSRVSGAGQATGVWGDAELER